MNPHMWQKDAALHRKHTHTCAHTRGILVIYTNVSLLVLMLYYCLSWYYYWETWVKNLLVSCFSFFVTYSESSESDLYFHCSERNLHSFLKSLKNYWTYRNVKEEYTSKEKQLWSFRREIQLSNTESIS